MKSMLAYVTLGSVWKTMCRYWSGRERKGGGLRGPVEEVHADGPGRAANGAEPAERPRPREALRGDEEVHGAHRGGAARPAPASKLSR